MSKQQHIHTKFTQIITKHQALIHKVCGVYGASTQDKEDLFQEIVLQLWRSYPTFKGQSKISTWMYRVALNTAISFYRKQSRMPQQEQLSLRIFQLPSQSVDTETEAQLQLMYKAIAQLNKIEKAIIMLYLDDYSYQQIADIIGISETKVGVKLHRIKTKLKKIVKKSANGIR